MPAPSTLADVRGVSVGQAESSGNGSGVSAVVFDSPSPTVVDVRGGASGTYDTASLALDATFGYRQAIFFSGGSLYGLDAASGIRRAILERGGGVRVFDNPNLIVPISGAILFDLPGTAGRLPNYERLGYRAAKIASRSPVTMGSVGAGAGATVGKYLGRERAARGGIGSAAFEQRGLGRVGALVAVNSVGAVRDPESGVFVEGPRDRTGAVIPLHTVRGFGSRIARQRGTTLVAVVTDVPLGRAALQRLAVYAHDGMARAVDPAHSATDGDVVFVSTTNDVRSRRREPYPGAIVDHLGVIVQWLVGGAILRAVKVPWTEATPPSGARRSLADRG
ncbi:MAG: P1 family peptidase [Thermoplasmata archaeon]|nr:P1 family peptidase [Thermoplasmata archaeon]